MVLAGPILHASKLARAATPLKLGYDNFALRALGWKAEQLIDDSIRRKLDSLFISDLDAFTSLETPALTALRERATAGKLDLHVGTWSVCPTSVAFKDKWGSATDHLMLGVRVAKDLGSPVLRVILGNGGDRATKGGIKQRMEDMVKVLQACEKPARDAHVKIAVENHAGDMQAHELAWLVEQAGPEFVGVNLDAGNSVWTLEDPLDVLEQLGRYTATTSLRDSMVWLSEHGATVQWTAMGDGLVDWKKYFKRFAELCPNVPVHIETISGFNRNIDYLKPDFWRTGATPKPKTSRCLNRWLGAVRR